MAIGGLLGGEMQVKAGQGFSYAPSQTEAALDHSKHRKAWGVGKSSILWASAGIDIDLIRRISDPQN